MIESPSTEAGGAAGSPPSSHAMSGRMITLIWMLLVLATLAGWALSNFAGSAPLSERPLEIGAILILAMAKIWLVLNIFMGLRDAPTPWKIAGLSWVIAAGVILYLLLTR